MDEKRMRDGKREWMRKGWGMEQKDEICEKAGNELIVAGSGGEEIVKYMNNYTFPN